MDKNTNIALVLCFAILVGFWWLNKPSDEERAKWQKYYDSLAQIEQLRQDSLARANAMAADSADTLGLPDSAKAAALTQKYGLLANAVCGNDSVFILENEKIKVSLSSQGAKILNVEIKGYASYSDSVLKMYGDEENTKFGFVFVHANRAYNTNDLFFSTSGVRNVGDTIPAEELPLLFERFHKSDKSRSEDKDGYGLGLYIVKTILRQHKEEINVTSENGVTTFTFSLRVE